MTEEKACEVIAGLSAMVHFSDPVDFETYSASLATALADLMEQSSGVINFVVSLWPDDLMRLSPWMPVIGGMFPPESMGWFEWIDAVARIP